MAWRLSTGTHSERKIAASALRSGTRQHALDDAADLETPSKKRSRPKKFGVELYYHSIFGGRTISYKQWYETERDRDQAVDAAEKQELCGEKRYSLVTKVSR